jgi:hypothetical protein
MAEMTVSPNNKQITFRGKAEKEMPSSSQARNRFMHAVAAGDVEGVSKSVGKEFVSADAGRKIGNLPEHAKHKKRKRMSPGLKAAHKRGLVSARAMAMARDE